jgi:hypothetical protein
MTTERLQVVAHPRTNTLPGRVHAVTTTAKVGFPGENAKFCTGTPLALSTTRMAVPDPLAAASHQVGWGVALRRLDY